MVTLQGLFHPVLGVLPGVRTRWGSVGGKGDSHWNVSDMRQKVIEMLPTCRRRKMQPKKATHTKKFMRKSFFRTISAGFLTHVTGKQAAVRAKFAKEINCVTVVFFWCCRIGGAGGWALDGRNRAIVIAESLARVVAAIQSLAIVGSHISHQRHTELSPRKRSLRCDLNRAIGIHSCNLWNGL